MTSRHDEVETKFDPPTGTALPDLRDAPDVASVEPPETHQLVASYYDTDGLALAANGITLRRRTGGTDEGWHLKLPAVDGVRVELHEPLSDEDSAPPDSLLAEVRVWIRGGELREVVQLSTQRSVQRLLDSESRVLAEFCDDHVTAIISGDESEVLTWHEWELELVDGRRKLLKAITKTFGRAGVPVSPHVSKLQRALGERLPSPRHATGVDSASATGLDVAVSYVRAHVAALMTIDPQVRRDELDAVHQMRVATRRLRSAFAIYGEVLDRRKTEPVRDELAWLAGVLGKARDAEVLSHRLSALVEGQDIILVLGSVAQRLESDLRGRYLLAHSRIIEALESERYFELLDSLESLLVDPPALPAAAKPANKVVRVVIRHEWTRVRRAYGAAGPAGARDDVHLHEIRKALKRLRYAAESGQSVAGRQARKLVKATKHAQQPLGDYQDSVMAREVLRQIGIQSHLDGDNGFTFGRLHALEEARAAQHEVQFEAKFSQLSGRAIARWLK